MRLLALVAAAALFVAACDPAAPSATPERDRRPSAVAASAGRRPRSSGAADAIYDAIEEQVLAIARPRSRSDVKRETIDEEALKAFNVKSFDEDNPPDYVAASERAVQGLRADAGGPVAQAAVPRPDRQPGRRLLQPRRQGALRRLAHRQINGADKITFAHEYDHALQDASFTVFADQKDLLDETDRALARAAVYEGDATLLMVPWAGRT